MVTPVRQQFSFDEYLRLEEIAGVKHEFLDGEIYAMAGGSEEHSALAAAVLRLLGNAVGDRPCRVHTSDLRIYVEAAGLATFPDGSVICGSLEQHGPSPIATAMNPSVLLEVTSDSSEEYDTGAKIDFYRTIPTLRDYIVVSHRERRITVHSRRGGGWCDGLDDQPGTGDPDDAGVVLVVRVEHHDHVGGEAAPLPLVPIKSAEGAWLEAGAVLQSLLRAARREADRVPQPEKHAYATNVLQHPAFQPLEYGYGKARHTLATDYERAPVA